MEKTYHVIPVPERVLDRIADAHARHDQACDDLALIIDTAGDALAVPEGYEFNLEMGCFVTEIPVSEGPETAKTN